MKLIKRIIKKILRSVFGLEVFRSSYIVSMPTEAEQNIQRLVASMQEFGVDLVLDVGANTGQFATELRQHGYVGRIVSFEPLSSAHNVLKQASSHDSKWAIFERCALGDKEGQVEINIAGNSQSSSILPMLESHRKAAPESAYQGKETVPLKTLDSVIGEIVGDAKSIFLKIDTQGFEWQVLDGAKEILPYLKGLSVELSLVPLYEGQYLWKDMINRLEADGFVMWAFKPVFSDQNSGRTLQVDGVFYRTS